MKPVALFLLLSVFSAAVIIQSQTVEALTIPERCTIPVPLHCKDYAAINESIKLSLVNAAYKGLIIKNITAKSEAFNPVNGTDSNHNCSLAVSERDKLLESDEGRVYTLDVSTEPGSKCSYYDTGKNKNRYFLEINYVWADSPVIEHEITGELFISYPEELSPSPHPLFAAWNVIYYHGLFLALPLILLIAAVVCFLKKKTGLAQILLLIFGIISLFVAALLYLGVL